MPYDPYLYFHGEEQSLAVRAYTCGWDIFHPTWVPLYHLYKEANTHHETHHFGVASIGTVGVLVLVLAKQKTLLPNIQPLLDLHACF